MNNFQKEMMNSFQKENRDNNIEYEVILVFQDHALFMASYRFYLSLPCWLSDFNLMGRVR